MSFNSKILILKKSYGSKKWHLPGGSVDYDESLEGACVREIKEETNIDCPNIKFLFSEGFFFKDKHMLRVVFKAASPTDEVVISDEHTDFAWVSKEEISNFEFVRKEKELIVSFLSD